LNLEFTDSDEISIYFKQLIDETNKKYNQKVVILVDEYDKAILDNIDNLKLAQEIRSSLRGFYTQIKDNDAYIEFCMLTGVSKFSKVSIFSGLNNLKDISLNVEFGDICGYTQNDLETVFKEYLIDVDMKELKSWYNGYNFLGLKVYNPYDILQFLDKNKEFDNYWFETGTPTFLMNIIKKQNYFLPNLNNIILEKKEANSFEIEDLKLETVMFQSGYLTIKEVRKKRDRVFYLLDFPNKEVKLSFYDYILEKLTNNEKFIISDSLYDILEDSSLDNLENTIKKLFSSIAYNNFTNNDIQNYEGFYASVLYTYFATLGLELIAEDVTNKGRIDLTIKFDNKVYIFEFKINSNDALSQIKEKKYYEKYLSADSEVYIIGICFDTKKRNLTSFEYEKIEY
ncbi:MAG: AAA family ATPase, partial [Campylobacteraceae bacterium]|nr:AAA family ATPase [Campylobacteraceae bacterium]